MVSSPASLRVKRSAIFGIKFRSATPRLRKNFRYNPLSFGQSALRNPHATLRRLGFADQRSRRHGADLRGFGQGEFKIRLCARRQFNPDFSVDRHVFVKRLRAWVNADGFLSPLNFKNFASFKIGPPAIWNFVASAGDGRTVEIELRAGMVEGKNATVFHFSRPSDRRATGKQLPAAPIAPDGALRHRGPEFPFRNQTHGGADFHFSSNTHSA